MSASAPNPQNHSDYNPYLEYTQGIELRAKEVLRQRAKDQCRELLAGFAACMEIEGLLGPIKCKSRLRILNDCLAQYMTDEHRDAVVRELIEEKRSREKK